MRWMLAGAMLCAALADPYLAAASLGGTADTVEADRARMQATARVTEKSAYRVHELTAQNGVTVREFVTPTGIVFGVAWQGATRPDLQQLLGGYFQHFTDVALAQKQHQAGRRAMQVHEAGLVVEGGGHARAFVGRAYVPQLVPAGVETGEIR
jgi:hypothetical protein